MRHILIVFYFLVLFLFLFVYLFVFIDIKIYSFISVMYQLAIIDSIIAGHDALDAL